MKTTARTCFKNSRIRFADRVAVPAEMLSNNSPCLSVGKRCVDSELLRNLRQLPLPIRFEKISMKEETRKQSIPPLLVDCSQKRPVRLKSCRYKSSIVNQIAVSDRDAARKFEMRTSTAPTSKVCID